MNSFLAIACASITGISLGIALHHKQNISPTSVGSQVTLQHNGAPQQPVALSTTRSNFGLTAAKFPAPLAQNTSLADTQLRQQLSALLEQQTVMRNQQSELNRELSAIQFRLDTHSESFRPLRSERNNESFSNSPSEPPISLSPLLPPRQ